MKKIGGYPSHPTPTLWLDGGSSSLSPFSPFINIRGEREAREAEKKKGWDYREESKEKQKKERNKRKRKEKEKEQEKEEEGEEITEK